MLGIGLGVSLPIEQGPVPLVAVLVSPEDKINASRVE